MTELNAKEALVGFVSWLSTRPEKIAIGADCDCAGLPELIEAYAESQGLSAVREDWLERLRPGPAQDQP